jgi:hypothetical protein
MKFKKIESGGAIEKNQIKRRSLSSLEAIADIGKWFTVTSLLPPAGSLAATDFEITALIGFTSGIVSQLIRENGANNEKGELASDRSPSGSKINFRRPVVDEQPPKNVKKKKKEKGQALTKKPYATVGKVKRRRKNIFDFVKSESAYLRRDLVKSILFDGEDLETSTIISDPKKQSKLEESSTKVESDADMEELLKSRDLPIFRFTRSGIESASQILVYIASRDYVYSLAPYFNS